MKIVKENLLCLEREASVQFRLSSAICVCEMRGPESYYGEDAGDDVWLDGNRWTAGFLFFFFFLRICKDEREAVGEGKGPSRVWIESAKWVWER